KGLNRLISLNRLIKGSYYLAYKKLKLVKYYINILNN
ncbi:hypothetical protein FPSE_07603, partial [Fusarium pseudograminearum CS3096]